MKNQLRLFHWLPRILCILAILFISMFSLDTFAPGLTLGEQILGFIMHNIPSYVLIALLVIAWKWEYIGGIIFILIGLLTSPFMYRHNYAMNHSVWISLSVILVINFPFVLVGVFFLLSNWFKKKEANKIVAS